MGCTLQFLERGRDFIVERGARGITLEQLLDEHEAVVELAHRAPEFAGQVARLLGLQDRVECLERLVDAGHHLRNRCFRERGPPGLRILAQLAISRYPNESVDVFQQAIGRCHQFLDL